MASQSTTLVSLQDPIDVSLSEIESELRKIWSAYGTHGDKASPAAVRATTFTLVVYEADETQQLLSSLGFYSGPIDGITGPRMQAAVKAAQKAYNLPQTGEVSPTLTAHLREEYQQQLSSGTGRSPDRYASDIVGGSIADMVASQNPCRVIALCPTLGEDTGITAQVAAYCPISKQTRSSLICCEYITLTGTVNAFARVSDLVESLLIHDLPRFLWWKGSLETESEIFRNLSPHFSSIIVDSSEFLTPLTDLVRVKDCIGEKMNIADLNWRRLAAWQELTAEAFDPPERRAAIHEIDQVVIDYEKGNPAQALMFLGWLASRLQWQPESFCHESGDYEIYTINLIGPDQRKIQAEVAGIPTGDPGEVMGDMIDLKLTSTNPGADCCTIICSETRGCMRMEAGGSAQTCRTYQVTPLADQSAEMLLSQQLQRWGRDALYEESMALTSEVLRLIQSN